jgi:hypothetical protein
VVVAAFCGPGGVVYRGAERRRVAPPAASVRGAPRGSVKSISRL